ncbi:MAG: DUF1353 domain-containing protein [Victivallaceae bacterium]
MGVKVEIFERCGSTWLRTLEPDCFELGGVTYTIPPGFECDGASIPRFFWRVIGTPMDCDYIKEAIRHDWLYRYRVTSRAAADRAFFRWLKRPRTRVRKYLLFLAVRAFGWIAWRKNKKERLKCQANSKCP